MAPYLGLGATLAVTVLGGVGIGHWLDGRLGTTPAFVLGGGGRHPGGRLPFLPVGEGEAVSFARYAQVVVAVAGVSLALLWPVAGRLGAGGWAAAAAGAALAVLNALAAYRLVLWSRNKPTVPF